MTSLGARLGFVVVSLSAACGSDGSNADDRGPVTTIGSQGSADDDGIDDGGKTTTVGDSGGTAADDGPTTAASVADSGTSTADGSDSADSGPPPSPSCQHQCATAADCFIDGMETGLGCNAGVCSIACTDDPTCVAAASGWTLIPCASTSDCASGGGVCVDIGGGVGGCSLQPSQGPCSDAGLVQTTAMTVEGSMVAVCGQPSAICVPLGTLNVCIVDCAGSACGGELSCQPDGLCHCDFDTQCVDAGQGNNCNAAGLCEWACQQPGDCPPPPFDGGQAVCQ